MVFTWRAGRPKVTRYCLLAEPLFFFLAAIDTSGRYTYEQFTKAFVSLQHSLLFFHEDAQVNGINFLMDFGDVKMNMITWVGLENWTKSADYGTVSLSFKLFYL